MIEIWLKPLSTILVWHNQVKTNQGAFPGPIWNFLHHIQTGSPAPRSVSLLWLRKVTTELLVPLQTVLIAKRFPTFTDIGHIIMHRGLVNSHWLHLIEALVTKRTLVAASERQGALISQIFQDTCGEGLRQQTRWNLWLSNPGFLKIPIWIPFQINRNMTNAPTDNGLWLLIWNNKKISSSLCLQGSQEVLSGAHTQISHRVNHQHSTQKEHNRFQESLHV